MTIPGHKSYVKTERYAKGEEYFQKQLQKKEPTTEEMLEWLEKRLNKSCLLQLSHPHLAWYPTEEDKAMWQAVERFIKKKPKATISEINNLALKIISHANIAEAIKEFLESKGFEVKDE